MYSMLQHYVVEYCNIDPLLEVTAAWIDMARSAELKYNFNL